MKIKNCILSDILLNFNFIEINKYKKYPDKRCFRKVGLCVILDGPNVIYSDNINDYDLSESNLFEELTSVIYFTQLTKKDRNILTEKLDLKINNLNKLYHDLKMEIEVHPQYSLLSEHYIMITKLKNDIEEAIDQLQ